MIRKAIIALLLVSAVAAAARASEFKLEERKYDIVRIKGIKDPIEGNIEKEDEHVLYFRKRNGEGRTWARSQVIEIKRKCTLQESYRRATEAAGSDPRAHVRLYEACLEANLKKEATAELKKAIKVDPKYLPAYSKLLSVAQATRDYDLELWTLETATRAGIATAPMLIRKAEVYVLLGLRDNAEEPLKRALMIEPFNAKAEARLAMLELARNKPDRAEMHIKAMLKRDSKNPYALVALGQLELASGRLDKAAEAFRKAAEQSESPEAAAGLAAIALRQGDYGKAATYYRLARKIRPDYAPALAGQALLSARRGKLREADALLRTAAATEPSRPEIVNARGYVAELAGKRDAALKLYETALSLDAANVFALAGAGRCHWEQGDRAKAAASFQRALSLSPSFPPALRGLARITLDINASQAARHLRKLVESGAATPEDHAALAGALIRLQRFGEAAAELAKAGSDSVHGRIGLGFLHYAQGRTDEAIAHFQAAVNLGDYRGYAAAAIARIREAEATWTWTDTFKRNDYPEVGNGWKEIEPKGVSISIANQSLLIDGKPAAGDLMARLSRPEGASFRAVTAEASTGSEAGSFVGVFLAPRDGKPAVLFGRYGSGRAAVLYPGRTRVRQSTVKIPEGKFTVGIEIDDRNKGVIWLLIDGRKDPRRRITVKEMADWADLDAGVFALPPKGQPVNCIFHTIRIVRSK